MTTMLARLVHYRTLGTAALRPLTILWPWAVATVVFWQVLRTPQGHSLASGESLLFTSAIVQWTMILLSWGCAAITIGLTLSTMSSTAPSGLPSTASRTGNSLSAAHVAVYSVATA